MLKKVFSLAFFSFFLFAPINTHASYFDNFEVLRLTDNDIEGYFPTISDNGDVVFGTEDGVYYYDTSQEALEKISDFSPTYRYHNERDSVSANEKGDIVWSASYAPGGGSQIFYYDSETKQATQLTSSPYERHDPHINNNGDIIWIENVPKYHPSMQDEMTDFNIVKYDSKSKEVSCISETTWSNQNPQLYENGDIVWAGYKEDILTQSPEEARNIYYYDSSSQEIIQLSDDSYEHNFPAIYKEEDVVWWRGDSLLLYDFSNETVTELFSMPRTLPTLGSNLYHIYEPISVNKFGDMVWSSNNNIFYYDGRTGKITQITDSPQYDRFCPQINSKGDIVWTDQVLKYVPSQDEMVESFEIFKYDFITNEIMQISNESWSNFFPQINDRGDIVWGGVMRDWPPEDADSLNQVFLAKAAYPPVPEPATFLLMGIGIIGLFFAKKS